MPKITSFYYGTLAAIPQVAEIPIVERLEFLTDQQTAYDGSEQNIQLRFKPRQTFQYKVPMRLDTSPSMLNTAYGAIRSLWAVPVWTDAQYVGNVVQGVNVINCDTTHYDLRAEGLAMLYDGCGRWEMLDVSAVGASSITTVVTVSRTYRGAMLIPVRVGFVIGNMARDTNGYSGKFGFNFQVQDTAGFTVADPEQYLANDIYYKPSLLDGRTHQTSLQRRQDITDYSLGPIESRTPWLITKIGQSYRNVSVNTTERKEFRDFIMRRAGKARPFWLPTFTHDIRITNVGNIVSALTAPRDSYIDYAGQRTHVAIEAGGVWYPRAITSVVGGAGDTMTVNLSAPLNVPAASVSRVSYLGLNRLDSDSVELNYNSPKVVETAVTLVEMTP
jgi:hypothetical protein